MEARGGRQHHLDGIVGLDFVVGLGGLLVDKDELVVNGQLNLVACGVGQTLHEKLIDPQGGLLGVYRKCMVFEKIWCFVRMLVGMAQNVGFVFIRFSKKRPSGFVSKKYFVTQLKKLIISFLYLKGHIFANLKKRPIIVSIEYVTPTRARYTEVHTSV